MFVTVPTSLFICIIVSLKIPVGVLPIDPEPNLPRAKLVCLGVRRPVWLLHLQTLMKSNLKDIKNHIWIHSKKFLKVLPTSQEATPMVCQLSAVPTIHLLFSSQIQYNRCCFLITLSKHWNKGSSSLVVENKSILGRRINRVQSSKPER